MAPEKENPTEEQAQAIIEDGGPDDANLAMSDEDFLKMPEEQAMKMMEEEEKKQLAAAGETPADKDEENDPDKKEEKEDEPNPDEKEDEKDDEDDPGESDEEAANKLKEAADKADATDKEDDDKSDEKGAGDDAFKEDDKSAKKEEEDPEKDEQKKKKDEKKVDKSAEVDYKAEYLKLTAPFKANGGEMKVKSTEDAIKLMQMGANYHKKMAGLKPSLKLLKLLENNELLDVGKLNFLIDLKKGNPEAIKKLVKDNGIDPLDINTKDEVQYTPTARTVDDKEIELDEVLRSIKDTPHYTETLNVITKSWDDKSRAAAANEPQIIATINAQIADGTYKAVSDAVLYERSMGRLTGVSDLDAYKKVGHDMGEAGELPFQQKAEKKPSPEADVKKEIPSKDAERQERKKKVATTRKVGGNDAEPTYDPLDMSDEDFENFDINSVPA